MYQQLEFQTLGDLDPRVVAAVNAAVAEIVQDLTDRPNLKSKRTITITLEFEPVLEGRDLGSVNFEYSVKKKTPDHSSRPYNLAVENGTLHFNAYAPENAGQRTIDDVTNPQPAPKLSAVK